MVRGEQVRKMSHFVLIASLIWASISQHSQRLLGELRGHQPVPPSDLPKLEESSSWVRVPSLKGGNKPSS